MHEHTGLSYLIHLLRLYLSSLKSFIYVITEAQKMFIINKPFFKGFCEAMQKEHLVYRITWNTFTMHFWISSRTTVFLSL